MKAIALNRLVSGLLLALGTCGLAQADTTYTYTYNYNNLALGSCSGSGTGTSCGLSGSLSSSSVTPSPAPADPNAPSATITATATAWANTNGGGTVDNQELARGTLNQYPGGLGVTHADSESTGSPQHSTDNDSRRESILYSFGQAIALSQVSIGWPSSGYDTDITVLAYTGGAFDVNTDLAGLRYSQLVSNGWTLVGNYADLSTSTPKAINAGGISSSYWLIGAANTLVTGGSNDSNNDYIKLAALGGTITTQNTPHTPPPPGVPEPGSLLLLGLGSLLLVRKRVKQG